MLRIYLRVYGATDRYVEPALVGVLVTVTASESRRNACQRWNAMPQVSNRRHSCLV